VRILRPHAAPPLVLKVEPVVDHGSAGPAEEVLEGMARVEERPNERLGQAQDASPWLRIAPAFDAVMTRRHRVACGGGGRGPIRDRYGQWDPRHVTRERI